MAENKSFKGKKNLRNVQNFFLMQVYSFKAKQLSSIFFIISLYNRELNCDQLSFTAEHKVWIRK